MWTGSVALVPRSRAGQKALLLARMGASAGTAQTNRKHENRNHCLFCTWVRFLNLQTLPSGWLRAHRRRSRSTGAELTGGLSGPSSNVNTWIFKQWCKVLSTGKPILKSPASTRSSDHSRRHAASVCLYHHSSRTWSTALTLPRFGSEKKIAFSNFARLLTSIFSCFPKCLSRTSVAPVTRASPVLKMSSFPAFVVSCASLTASSPTSPNDSILLSRDAGTTLWVCSTTFLKDSTCSVTVSTVPDASLFISACMVFTSSSPCPCCPDPPPRSPCSLASPTASSAPSPACFVFSIEASVKCLSRWSQSTAGSLGEPRESTFSTLTSTCSATDRSSYSSPCVDA
mmetsp:Transcript_17307/g.42277  ORF Transcript_17307/g.42277 Transcript_17307/m.42277 type:complete len:342 (-) Transcript_17307:55-1080(-)